MLVRAGDAPGAAECPSMACGSGYMRMSTKLMGWRKGKTPPWGRNSCGTEVVVDPNGNLGLSPRDTSDFQCWEINVSVDLE
jgi:hypothetical protein